MKSIRIFISSVQVEFAKERQMLFDYIFTDALLGHFFEPFIFEKIPASNCTVQTAFCKGVEQCDIYIAILGKSYGFEDAQGISPTEREFDLASKLFKHRLIFIQDNSYEDICDKEKLFIKKTEQVVVRKTFSGFEDLKTSIYASLIRYLEEKEIIRRTPFDATFNKLAGLDDLDEDKIKDFVRIARKKRNFPFAEDVDSQRVLAHLNLINENRITNAAILLFGKHPQRFFLTSEVKCAHFHGNNIEKPIRSLQVYKGDLFQLVLQATDFILSKVDSSVGVRDSSPEVDVEYELPVSAVIEAIVNAIVHRDYTSNGSVQVMLFKNRLEIWNPGKLPFGLTVEKLKSAHSSMPQNPLIAEPMYLKGVIERMGTGTEEIVRRCLEFNLPSPEFIQEDDFKLIIWRKHAAPQDTPQDTPQDIFNVERLMLVLSGEMSRQELKEKLGITNTKYFRIAFINPAIAQGLIEMTHPDKPNSKHQKYRKKKS